MCRSIMFLIDLSVFRVKSKKANELFAKIYSFVQNSVLKHKNSEGFMSY